MTVEKVTKNYSDNIKQMLRTTILGLLLNLTEAKAFEPEEVDINSNPFQSSELLLKSSKTGGDDYESQIISVKVNGNWYSVGLKGNSRTIPGIKSDEVQKKLIDKISELGSFKVEKTLLTHNHPTEVIVNHLEFFKLKVGDIKRKDSLLTGPSYGYGDCPDSLEHVSVVVDPGGKWLCKVLDESLKNLNNKILYDKSRSQLLMASQNLAGVELQSEIDKFMASARVLGLKIEFISNSVSEEEYLKKVETF